MAPFRATARSYGTPDPIDALVVARAALGEPNLTTACLDGPAREVRLLRSHLEGLVAERNQIINRLRRHLQELWSGNREWHRLFRIGKPQLNTALHHIAITQSRYPRLPESSSTPTSQRQHRDRVRALERTPPTSSSARL